MQNSKVEDTYFRAKQSIRVGERLIDLSTPIVMGIINTTPDSFYSGSRVQFEDDVIQRVKEMLSAGATIIDIGGYSSRPDAIDISVEEEISRVVPVIQRIIQEVPDTIISIDTFRSAVAEQAILAGASIINDISGFEIDPKIAEIAGKYRVPYILMHMKGTPQTMKNETEYGNIFQEMMYYFSEKISKLKSLGLHDIILDPGFGFSKTIEDNYRLINNLNHFSALSLPILVGISRKSMIYKKLGISPVDALNGTTVLNTIAVKNGANILRVHDVNEAVEVIQLSK